MIVFYELFLGPSFKEDYGKMLVVTYLSTGFLTLSAYVCTRRIKVL